MSGKDEKPGKPAPKEDEPLTEDDVAQVQETLEALALIGKAPASVAAEIAKGATVAAPAPAGAGAGGAGASAAPSKADLLSLLARKPAAGKPEGEKEHRFWSTQPVLKKDEKTEEHGPIDAPKTVAEVKQEPYGLPAGFEWCTIDVTNAAQRRELSIAGSVALHPGLARGLFTKFCIASSFPSPCSGAVRASSRQLRGGRRRNVPLQLQREVPSVGPHASPLLQGVDRWCPREL
jgi:Myristoyl-CoA:protein N-myristoyltransferase, N-terminal domain